MVKGISEIFQQAQKMKAKMDQIQEEMVEKRVEGTAGGGMVQAIANGKQEIVEIKIDPEVVDPKDIEMLQDLIVAAVNEALKNSHKLFTEEMGKVTGNIDIGRLKEMFPF